MDSLPLRKEAKALVCEKGHTYDYAKEGYCNLLLVQQKGSLDPGDNKEMVAARKRFLDGDHFSAIAEKSFDFVHVLALESGRRAGSVLSIVDAGCGEGYYLHKFAQYAEESPNAVRLELAGFDISKWAIKSAAKRSRKIAWLVASNSRLPFGPASVDLILSLFGFPIWDSFRAVQPKGGMVLLVDPAPNHLIELRRVIYPQVKESSLTSLDEALRAGYTLEREEGLEFKLNLKAPEIRDLLNMTPHAHRISAKGAENLAEVEELEVSVDLAFRLLRLP